MQDLEVRALQVGGKEFRLWELGVELLVSWFRVLSFELALNFEVQGQNLVG